MTTPFANDQLSAYLDGELSDAEQRELESLLEADAELRSELEALERATDFFRTHAPARAPAEFVDHVMALADAEPLPANNSAAWWRRPFGVPIEGVAVAAAALLVLGVSLNMGGVTGQPDVDVSTGMAKAPDAKGPQKADAKPKTDGAMAKNDVGAAPLDPTPSGLASAAGKVEGALTGDVAKGAASAYEMGEKAMGLDSASQDPQVATEPAKTEGSADKNVMGSNYTYTITTDDPEVMADLMRLASKFNASGVEDASGRGVDGTAMDGKTEGTFQVHLPSHALAKFGDALHGLGKVQATPSDSWFAGEVATVQINVRVLGGTGELTKPKLRRGKGTPSY